MQNEDKTTTFLKLDNSFWKHNSDSNFINSSDIYDMTDTYIPWNSFISPFNYAYGVHILQKTHMSNQEILNALLGETSRNRNFIKQMSDVCFV